MTTQNTTDMIINKMWKIYFRATGTTEKMANTIADKLTELAEDLRFAKNFALQMRVSHSVNGSCCHRIHIRSRYSGRWRN